MVLLPKGQEEVQKCKMSQQSNPNLFPAESWRSGRWRLPFAPSAGDEGLSAQHAGTCLQLHLEVVAVQCLYNDVGSQNISKRFQASEMLQSM